MDSVIGIEYRDRKARAAVRHHALADRPLHHRHRAGREGAQQAGHRRLVVHRRAALTNGSNTTEQFHFYDEIDTNAGKTASGRLAVRAPAAVRDRAGHLGLLRAAGSRQGQRATPCGSSGPTCRPTQPRLDLKAQWLTGAAPGDPIDDTCTAWSCTRAATSRLDWMMHAAHRRHRAGRVPRRVRLAGRSQRPRRGGPRLPDQVVARHRRAAFALLTIASSSRPSTCTTASTAASRKSRTTSSRRRCC